MTDKNKKEGSKDTSVSKRFTALVVKEFSSEVGEINLTPIQKKLAQHLFIKVDMAMAEAEKKRLEKSNSKAKTPIIWQNVNMQKLAVDAVHRVSLGLDALIPNHIHPIPYFNTRNKSYDIDLRIGFKGKDCYYRKLALVEPDDIVYELVYSKDKFMVFKKDQGNDIESYTFGIPEPFDRGEVIGGFGYISYPKHEMNRLVLVNMADFAKSKNAAGTNKFWGAHEETMQLKTITHRTVGHIVLDPEKINASFANVERDESTSILALEEGNARAEIGESANQQIIDVNPVVIEPQVSDKMTF